MMAQARLRLSLSDVGSFGVGKTGDSPPNRGPVSGKGDMISIRAGSDPIGGVRVVE